MYRWRHGHCHVCRARLNAHAESGTDHETVLITGGTGAIGEALCRRFDDTHAHVIANCHPDDIERSEALVAELVTQGNSIELAPFDVTDHQECHEHITRLDAASGGISILINGAGITRDASIAKLSPDDWDAVLRTNLDSVYHVSKACLPGMKSRGYGRIINISSVNGQRGQFGQTNYSAAKAGMTGFTRALAREVARYGITANAVSPGYVRSPMTEVIPADIREALIAEIPMGRAAEPEEIAHAISFLAARESSYITGIDLSVNGGYHIG